ncbi:MAG TPA: NAD(P)/FAD-dependent oxidoreductase [Pseudonocardiaceae bacterium]|jgi:NADH dehydrogenase|nr:NAD(P)/FAD-dependent oxidoreductase [Pseudonocardiaceae bacterium]
MSTPRVVIIGAGFAGYNAAKSLSRTLAGRAEIVLINPTDYFLYLPLLPEVAVGLIEPRRTAVSIPETLPDVRLILAEVDRIDLAAREVRWTDAEDARGSIGYDRLIVAAGSVNKLLPIPGVAEHAHGFRDLSEALYLRDHLTRQFELADATDDPDERAARLTFVVVGAGYTGTEVAAQGVRYTKLLRHKHPRLAEVPPRWLLLDVADRLLPGLSPRLAGTADRVLRGLGVDVRMGTSVKEATKDGVLLTDGETIGTRSLIWCVGVRPDPLIDELGLELDHGRLVVDKFLGVPGHADVFACGDVAAAPDLTRPGKVTPMTAQHAERQGRRVAGNVAASLGHGRRVAYKHHDLGFVVDLGGTDAAANPLRIPLGGFPAKVVTRGYHLLSLPGNRIRIAADWLLDAVLSRQTTQLGLVRGRSVPLDTRDPD